VEEEVEGVGIENDAVLRHGMQDGGDVGEEAAAGEGAEDEGVRRRGRVVVGAGPFEETKLLRRVNRLVGKDFQNKGLGESESDGAWEIKRCRVRVG